MTKRIYRYEVLSVSGFMDDRLKSGDILVDFNRDRGYTFERRGELSHVEIKQLEQVIDPEKIQQFWANRD